MQRVTNSRRRAHSGARSTVTACGYQNRSEALRDLARAGIAQVQETADASRAAVAALTYVYDHRQRELAKRLTRSFHDRHDLSVASMHVHLDHDSCLGQLFGQLFGSRRSERYHARCAGLRPACHCRARCAPRAIGYGSGRVRESKACPRSRAKPAAPPCARERGAIVPLGPLHSTGTAMR